jgi:hypothetical protein
MLRMMSALFGTIFLPVGISFFFVLHHRHWPEGLGAVVAALGFFYVAWRADDILGLDTIADTREISLPGLPPPGDDATGHAAPEPAPDAGDPPSESQEPLP